MIHPDRQPHKVIIADDHRLFADGLEQLVNSIEGFVVVGKADNGRSLLQLLNSIATSLILLDINMPLLNGIDAAVDIYKRCPGCKIILVSMYFTPKIIHSCKQMGIDGLIPKDSSADLFKTILPAVINGEKMYAVNIGTPVNDTPVSDPQMSRYNLSDRELEIIQLIKKGLTSKEIAATLFLSELTIETHRKNIFRKLNVKSSVALLTFAHEHGI